MIALKRHSHVLGFSLLELLVVIAIIAVLATVLIPCFKNNRERGRRTVCHDNLRAIHYCLTMYEQTEGMFPVSTGKDRYSGDAQEALNLLYRQYTDDVRIFSCPSKPLSESILSSIMPASSGPVTGWPTTPGSAFKEAPPGTVGASTSFGYSPGHDSASSRVVVMADRQGTGKNGNSDNHGRDAGQNVLAAGGRVQFITVRTNVLGRDKQNIQIVDSDIFAGQTITPSKYVEWDSFCR